MIPNIILCGGSGIGKTTLAKLMSPDYAAVDTGDLFKALFALGADLVRPQEILNDDAAFEFFVQSGELARGVEKYERLKEAGQAASIIHYIETLRALCPDLPARAVNAIAEEINKPVITTAINQDELDYLCKQAAFRPSSSLILHLACKNPVRRAVDNRKECPLPTGSYDFIGYRGLLIRAYLKEPCPTFHIVYHNPHQTTEIADFLRFLLSL